MKKQTLPLVNPFISHDPPIANLFSILGNNPNTESWIMNNFINIYIKSEGIFDNFYDRNTFFYGCPWIQVVQIRREIVMQICNDIIDYVKALINEGFYVYAVGNTEYIPAYHREHYWAHNLMIYGYDDEKKEFYIADFFVNGKYAHDKCTYLELENALKTAEVNRDFVNLIYGIKLKDIEYKFEVDILVEKLKDYLNSENLFCKYKTRQDEEFYSNRGGNSYNYFSYSEMKNSYHFGLSYYDKLIDMARNNSRKLLRPLDLLFEHKVLMGKRIDFLYKNGHISRFNYENLKTLCDNTAHASLILRNIYLKEQIASSKSNLACLEDKTTMIKDLDCRLFENLLNAIKFELNI